MTRKQLSTGWCIALVASVALAMAVFIWSCAQSAPKPVPIPADIPEPAVQGSVSFTPPAWLAPNPTQEPQQVYSANRPSKIEQNRYPSVAPSPVRHAQWITPPSQPTIPIDPRSSPQVFDSSHGSYIYPGGLGVEWGVGRRSSNYHHHPQEPYGNSWEGKQYGRAVAKMPPQSSGYYDNR